MIIQLGRALCAMKEVHSLFEINTIKTGRVKNGIFSE